MTSRSLLLTLLALGLAVVAGGRLPAAGQPRLVMMASTIGPVDAGIVSALEDAYFTRTGVVVRHTGAGTGAALEMAKGGSFEADRYGEPLFFPNGDDWRKRHGDKS